jgi:hypothetical protein
MVTSSSSSTARLSLILGSISLLVAIIIWVLLAITKSTTNFSTTPALPNLIDYILAAVNFPLALVALILGIRRVRSQIPAEKTLALLGLIFGAVALSFTVEFGLTVLLQFAFYSIVPIL